MLFGKAQRRFQARPKVDLVEQPLVAANAVERLKHVVGGPRVDAGRRQQQAHRAPPLGRLDVGGAGLEQRQHLGADGLGQLPRHVGVEPADELQAPQQLLRHVLLVRQQAPTHAQQPKGRALHQRVAGPEGPLVHDGGQQLVHDRPHEQDAVAVAQRQHDEQLQADFGRVQVVQAVGRARGDGTRLRPHRTHQLAEGRLQEEFAVGKDLVHAARLHAGERPLGRLHFAGGGLLLLLAGVDGNQAVVSSICG